MTNKFKINGCMVPVYIFVLMVVFVGLFRSLFERPASAPEFLGLIMYATVMGFIGMLIVAMPLMAHMCGIVSND